MVYTERAETAAVSRGTSHVKNKQRCKYTSSAEIRNALLKATVTHLESHATRALCVFSRERRIVLYKSDQQHVTHSSEPLWPSGKGVRLVSGRTSVRYRFGSPFSSERLWFVDTVL